MREATLILFTICLCCYACFGIAIMARSNERANWCDKYTVKTEYQECMKVGSAFDNGLKREDAMEELDE